jgi:hypothetical protein
MTVLWILYTVSVGFSGVAIAQPHLYCEHNASFAPLACVAAIANDQSVAAGRCGVPRSMEGVGERDFRLIGEGC